MLSRFRSSASGNVGVATKPVIDSSHSTSTSVSGDEAAAGSQGTRSAVIAGSRLQSPEELRGYLEASLAERCGILRASFADGSSDALTLIDLIAEPTGNVIRRAPIAAQRSLKLARNENSSLSQLVQLISSDPALAQALLRLANSATYATSGAPSTSIIDAIRRVGSTGVESVVLRCMIEGLLCRPGGEYQTMSDLVWKHMVRTAPIGRGLGRLFDTNLDEAFLLAMMHDVGKLVVFDRIGTLRTALRRDAKFPGPFMPAVLRLVHEPLGGLAALEWGLGEKAAGAIASHHRREVFEFSDRASQLLFAAERTDLARTAGSPINAEPWIALGGLAVDRGLMETAISAIPEEPVR